MNTVDLHASVIKLEAKLNAKEKEINVHKARSQEAVGARRGLESELVTTKEELEAVSLDMKEIRNGNTREDDEDNYSNERRRSSTGLGKYSTRRCEQRSLQLSLLLFVDSSFIVFFQTIAFQQTQTVYTKATIGAM